MVDSVFSFGELGFQEFETSRYLASILEKEGFHIQRNFADIPTAWIATWGEGSPSSLSAPTSTISRKLRRNRASAITIR